MFELNETQFDEIYTNNKIEIISIIKYMINNKVYFYKTA